MSLSQAASSVGSSIAGLSRALRICVGVASHCLVQPCLEVVAGLGRLHLGQLELGFQLADQTEVRLVDPEARELKEALVDVADLLHVQALVGQPLGGAALALQDDQRAEHLGGHQVGDRHPVEPRVARRVEHAAAVGRDAHLVVLAAAVDSGKRSEQARPGRRAQADDLVAVQVPLGLELVIQRADRVGVRIELRLDREQFVFLGVQQEHQAHHDGERAPVDLARFDHAEQRARGLAVQPGQLADEEFHGLADLGAKGVGDLGLRGGALREQFGESAAATNGARSRLKKARSRSRSSSQRSASNVAVVVGSFGRAWTRTQFAPLVSSARGTPRSRHRAAACSAGES